MQKILKRNKPSISDLVTMKNLLESLTGLYKRLLSNNTQTRLLPCVQRGVEAIISEMKYLGHPVRLVQGYRSLEEQTRLYNQGRTTPGNIVTNAKAGQSFHNYGCAVDLVFIKEGYDANQSLWETLGVVGEKHGFEWGGRWKGFTDKPHFEMKKGYTLSDFQNGKVDFNKFN